MGEEKKISVTDALAQLLKDRVLFPNERQTAFQGELEEGTTTVLYVNCSDIFVWGCADAENLPNNEIKNLYNFHIDPNNKGWGSDKWCCIRRNEQPQRPVIDRMKAEGAWDDVMESLPLNNYDNGK